jgi:hypothetical protein
VSHLGVASRQAASIAKAKAEGVYRGGKRRIDREAVFKLRDKGKGTNRDQPGARDLADACVPGSERRKRTRRIDGPSGAA